MKMSDDTQIEGFSCSAEDLSSKQTPTQQNSQIHGLSFATDCLFNSDAVEEFGRINLENQNSLLTMLKARINLEQYYASELARISQTAQFSSYPPSKVQKNGASFFNESTEVRQHADEEEEEEEKSVCFMLQKLRSQYSNASQQHYLLAQNLREDVYNPIDAIYKRHLKKSQKLSELTSKIKREAKAVENVYKKCSAKFDRQFREASVMFTAAVDAGIDADTIRKLYNDPVSDSSDSDSNSNSSSVADREDDETRESTQCDMNSSRSHDSKLTRRNTYSFMKKKHNSSSNLVSWLLPTDVQKKENLGAQVVKAISKAETSRRDCRRHWSLLQEARIEQYRSIQSILSEFQLMEEKRIENLSTNLRKQIVFEVSSIANRQYDWQMLSGVLENLNFESDLHKFIIRKQRNIDPTMTVEMLCRLNSASVSMTNSDHVKEFYLPYPPSKKRLRISHITQRKIPYEEENEKDKSTVLGLLATSSNSNSTTHLSTRKDQKVVSAIATAKAIRAAYDLKVSKDETQLCQGMLLNSNQNDDERGLASTRCINVEKEQEEASEVEKCSSHSVDREVAPVSGV